MDDEAADYDVVACPDLGAGRNVGELDRPVARRELGSIAECVGRGGGGGDARDLNAARISRAEIREPVGVRQDCLGVEQSLLLLAFEVAE